MLYGRKIIAGPPSNIEPSHQSLRDAAAPPEKPVRNASQHRRLDDFGRFSQGFC